MEGITVSKTEVKVMPKANKELSGGSLAKSDM